MRRKRHGCRGETIIISELIMYGMARGEGLDSDEARSCKRAGRREPRMDADRGGSERGFQRRHLTLLPGRS